jgi:hypothetical protein
LKVALNTIKQANDQSINHVVHIKALNFKFWKEILHVNILKFILAIAITFSFWFLF